MPPDYAGLTFGRWTVLAMSPRWTPVRALWTCRCECGVERDVYLDHLRDGSSRSCGCLARQMMTTHGLTDSPTYNSWHSMLQRCENKKHRSYENYGGRGVAVCERWQSFEVFLADMGERQPGTTLDRFPDRDGDYEPSNCRWATVAEQNRNQRQNVLGVIAVCLIRHMRRRGSKCADIAHAFGVSKSQVSRVSRRLRWNDQFNDEPGRRTPAASPVRKEI